VLLGITLERLFPTDGAIDFGSRDAVRFCEAVRQDRQAPAMEEIQESVLHMAQCRAKLVNIVAQQVGFGPAQFMPQLGQPLNPNNAFGKALRFCFFSSRSQSRTGAVPSSSLKKTTSVRGMSYLFSRWCPLFIAILLYEGKPAFHHDV
jgi:hypothetical protein